MSKLKRITDILKDGKKTISFAESCTGGLLASCLTDISGASEYFNESFVTYSNEAKNSILGVNKDTLNKYGAVSPEVALEMAEGLLKKTKADIAVATTGIAGPSGGSFSKPIGLIYIGIASKERSMVTKYLGPNNAERTVLKGLFVQKTFEAVYDFLTGRN